LYLANEKWISFHQARWRVRNPGFSTTVIIGRGKPGKVNQTETVYIEDNSVLFINCIKQFWMKHYYLQWRQFQFIDLIACYLVFFGRCRNIYRWKDGSAPLEKLSPSPVPSVSPYWGSIPDRLRRRLALHACWVLKYMYASMTDLRYKSECLSRAV